MGGFAEKKGKNLELKEPYKRDLRPDFVKGIFVSHTEQQAIPQDVPREGMPQDIMNAKAFHQMVAKVAQAQMVNQIPRMSLVPALSHDALNTVMIEPLPYAWMATLLKLFGSDCESWAEHPMATLVWQVVNEELRSKRQGQPFALPRFQNEQSVVVVQLLFVVLYFVEEAKFVGQSCRSVGQIAAA